MKIIFVGWKNKIERQKSNTVYTLPFFFDNGKTYLALYLDSDLFTYVN